MDSPYYIFIVSVFLRSRNTTSPDGLHHLGDQLVYGQVRGEGRVATVPPRATVDGHAVLPLVLLQSSCKTNISDIKQVMLVRVGRWMSYMGD